MNEAGEDYNSPDKGKSAPTPSSDNSTGKPSSFNPNSSAPKEPKENSLNHNAKTPKKKASFNPNTEKIKSESKNTKENIQKKDLNLPKRPDIKRGSWKNPHTPRKSHQKLYNDGKKKERGRCHQTKSINNFYIRRKKGKEYPKSTCKVCDGETKQIGAQINKVNIMSNIYNGKLKGKCQNCNTDQSKLPSLEFHHTDPKIKNTTWHEKMYSNWQKTM